MPGIAPPQCRASCVLDVGGFTEPLCSAQPPLLLPAPPTPLPALQQPPGSLAHALSDPSFFKTSKVAIDSAKKRARMQPRKEEVLFHVPHEQGAFCKINIIPTP